MDPAAGTGTGNDPPAGAGAGEVPMAAVAAPGAVVAAAPPAGAAAAARPALNWRINLRRRAGEVPMAVAAAAAPGAVVVRVAVAAAPASPAGAAAAARPALNWRDLRRRWAQALLILGCAAAALAFFSINSSPAPAADFRRLLGACPPSEAEAAALRAASRLLLVFAAAQVLGATTALLVPARRVAIFLSVVGWHTGCRAARVLRMLFECHGRLDAELVIYYWMLEAVMVVGYLVGSAVVRSAY